jgi:ankyrin repeat protein
MDRLFQLAGAEDAAAFRDALVVAKQQGLDVNQRDGEERTLLHLSAQYGRRENVVELLNGEGKDRFHQINAMDRSGQTALYLACYKEHTGVVEELVEGAGREAGFTAYVVKDFLGGTALHCAWNEETVQLVVEGAARIGAETRHALVHATDWAGRTAMLCYGPKQGLLNVCSEEELDFLLCTKDKKGHNPLHYAAFHRDAGGIRTLLRGVRERGWRGTSGQEEWRNSLDDAGMTALHLAILSPDNGCWIVAGVSALLSPPGEGGGGGEGTSNSSQGGAGEVGMKEYDGGVDPNRGCKGRAAPRFTR